MSNSTSPAVPDARIPGDIDDGIEHERAYVKMLYERLDARRAETARRLSDVLHDETVGTPQALTERDAAAAMYTDRLAALRAAEHGLAFGRLDADGRRAPLRRPARAARRGQRVRAAADGLAGAGGAAVLHGHRGVSRRASAGAGTCAPAAAR